MKHLITKSGKHDWFIKKSINKKYALPLVTFGTLIQNSALGKVLRTTLALVLTIGLIPHTQLLRAYAQDSNSQITNSNAQTQPSSNEQANYVLVVENGDIDNTEGATIPAYSLVFIYSDSKPETYEGHKVVEADTNFLTCNYVASWDLYNSNITEVTFASVTCPQSTDSWFYGFENLTIINGIENLDTSYVSNMDYMFAGCSSLTKLDVSSFNTSKVQDMDYMFSDCSSLTYLDVSSFDTKNVWSMDCMFAGCSSLTYLNVSSFDTNNVRSMYFMFDSCSNLTSLDVSSFDTRNVEDMIGMFGSCSSLTNLDVSSFDTRNVEYMIGMFDSCSSLTSLDVSSFDTRNVEEMGGMFYNCSSLTNLDVSSFVTSSVLSMDCMFEGCSSLTNLNVSSFDTSNVKDMECMFYNCSSLTSLDVSSFDTSNVTDMKYMFSGNTKLETIVASNLWYMGQVNSSSDMFKDCTSLKGACGTVYDSNYIDKTYARIDGGSDRPGYFS